VYIFSPPFFFLPNFNQIWIFSIDFRKSPQRKIRPVGATLKYVDRRTGGELDTAKLIDAFRDSANASHNDDETPHKWTGKTSYTHFVKTCPRTEVPYFYGHTSSVNCIKTRLFWWIIWHSKMAEYSEIIKHFIGQLMHTVIKSLDYWNS
jgi:hypothetical protein